MPKYRLIKSYPGSPKLGTIVSTCLSGGIYQYGTCTMISKTTNFVTDFPEFWEPIDELEEEVLKIINEQIVIASDGDFWRYAPEYAAHLIAQLFKDKLK